VLRAALDRAVPLVGGSPHRCRTTPAPDPGGDGDVGVGGDPVFTPIDQHGYPTLDRALAPTSLARLAARHLDGRPPVRRIMAPTPRPAEPATPPATPPPPPPPGPPSAATLQAVHRARPRPAPGRPAATRRPRPAPRRPRAPGRPGQPADHRVGSVTSRCRGGRRRARVARGHDRVGDRLWPGPARPAARPRSCAAPDPAAARAGAARGPAGRHPRPRRLPRGPPGPPTRSTTGIAGSAGHPVAPGSRPRPPRPGDVLGSVMF
jgi:hypothetical protein